MFNRKGETGEQMMIFILMLFMLLVGGGVVGGVILFYGGEIDARGDEAGIFAYRIEKCLIDMGSVFRENIFYEKCGIKKESFEEKEIFFSIKKIEQGVESEIHFGSNFEACNFIGAKENKHYPRCVKKEFINIKNGIKEEYTIVVGNNHFGTKENVAA